MLDISRSERYVIITLLILGTLFLAFSYFQKTTSNPEIEIINIKEPHVLIDINTATALQFEHLPGIGPVLAENIILYREEKGLFKSPEELKNVKGIGDKKFEKIRDFINLGE